MGKRGPVGQLAKETSGTESKVSVAHLVMPTYLTPIAKEYWQKLIAAFPREHFTLADQVLMEQYCEAAALHRNATATLQNTGRRYKDKNGVWRKHPAADDQHQARCDCAMLATKLRITKTSMISPKGTGRAAQNAAESALIDDQFGDLLFAGEEIKQ